MKTQLGFNTSKPNTGQSGPAPIPASPGRFELTFQEAYGFGEEKMNSLLDLLARQEQGDATVAQQIKNVIRDFEEAAAGLEAESLVRGYALGWKLRKANRAVRIAGVQAMLRGEVTIFRIPSSAPEPHALQLVRGLFGRELSADPPDTLPYYFRWPQPAMRVLLREVPVEIIESFVRGMDISQIRCRFCSAAGPSVLAGATKARARCNGASYDSPFGDREFDWTWPSSCHEWATVQFTLPFAYVDAHTRDFCRAAQGRLVSHYRRLGRADFARWVLRTYPQVCVSRLLPMLLPGERLAFAAWAKKNGRSAP